MPAVQIAPEALAPFGQRWKANNGSLSRSVPFSSGQLGNLFDRAVGSALAVMLGGIPIATPVATSLIPPHSNCVEVGPVRIIGGVRPQNFDVGYRPDGVRFVFDSKTLNDAQSVGKNWQNMINDLATEATTVHSRFPHALVAFLVAIPSPCVRGATLEAIIETLERLSGRSQPDEAAHRAEAIALVLWEPADGTIVPDLPPADSPLRIERFAAQVETIYTARYKGLPPHTA